MHVLAVVAFTRPVHESGGTGALAGNWPHTACMQAPSFSAQVVQPRHARDILFIGGRRLKAPRSNKRAGSYMMPTAYQSGVIMD